jgi:NAD+ kinase
MASRPPHRAASARTGSPARAPVRARGRESRPARVALVVKRSAWAAYMEEPESHVHELIARRDPAVAHLRSSHDEHLASVTEVRQALEGMGLEVTRIPHGRRPFDASPFDLVVTVGGDGTVLHASHSVGTTPVLAINSCPSRSVGFFCGARSGEAERVVGAALRGKLKRALLSRMQVSVNGKLVAGRVLNDALFCHACPAHTSRYLVEFDGQTEEQKSSGFWIGPAAGSTAAQRAAGGRVLSLSSRLLQLVVREPYTPQGDSYTLARVLIRPGQQLRVRSKSREARLFLDGHEDMVPIGLGDVLDFSLSPEPLQLLGISAHRKWGRQPAVE